MRHRPDHSDSVGDAGYLRQSLRRSPCPARWSCRFELALNLGGRRWLRIKRFVLRRRTEREQQDARFALPNWLIAAAAGTCAACNRSASARLKPSALRPPISKKSRRVIPSHSRFVVPRIRSMIHDVVRVLPLP